MRSEASTIDTGSSATISAGCEISARAIATRCSWPPDSSCGKRPRTSASDRPTLRSASSAAACDLGRRRGAAEAPRGRRTGSGRRRFSGLKASNGFWKIGCTCRMKASRSRAAADRRAGRVPRKRIAPRVGGTMLRIMRASVVLPLPDSPMIVKISGSSASSRKLTSSTASTRRRESSPPRREGLARRRELEQRARSWRAAPRRVTAKQATRWPGASVDHAAAPRGGRCPWPAGSADGSGSPAADRRGWAARPSSPPCGAASPMRGRLAIRCAV